jgi:hypothetical protein
MTSGAPAYQRSAVAQHANADGAQPPPASPTYQQAFQELALCFSAACTCQVISSNQQQSAAISNQGLAYCSSAACTYEAHTYQARTADCFYASPPA